MINYLAFTLAINEISIRARLAGEIRVQTFAGLAFTFDQLVVVFTVIAVNVDVEGYAFMR